jgi:hypothetical protein
MSSLIMSLNRALHSMLQAHPRCDGFEFTQTMKGATQNANIKDSITDTHIQECHADVVYI